jgi:hypothetical protein
MCFELDTADIPVGTEITALGLTVDGSWFANVHAAGFTLTLPTFQLISVNATGIVTAETAADPDASVNLAGYEAAHTIVVGPFSITVAANTRYLVRIKGEFGGNAAARRLAVRTLLVVKNGP